MSIEVEFDSVSELPIGRWDVISILPGEELFVVHCGRVPNDHRWNTSVEQKTADEISRLQPPASVELEFIKNTVSKGGVPLKRYRATFS